MNKKFLSCLFATSLVASQVPFLSSNINPALALSPKGQRFECVKSVYTGYGLIGYNDAGFSTAPLITFERTYFEPSGYTPERRCHEVTQRLNEAVNYTGYPDELWLTSGKVNRLTVICYVRGTDTGCNQQNVLLTISKTSPNFNNPTQALRDLINFAATGTGSAIAEQEGQVYANMGELIKLSSDSNSTPSPVESSPENPSNSIPSPVTPKPENPSNSGGWKN